MTQSKVKKKNTWPTHRRKKKLDPHDKKKKKTCPARVKKKTYPHIEEGGKSTHLGLQLFRGEGGGHSQKEGIFLICDNDIPIQSEACWGGCFELQTLYGACRVFVLKSSKSQDILVKIGCFTQNGDLSNTHTSTPAHIHKFNFGFLHVGAVVRFV